MTDRRFAILAALMSAGVAAAVLVHLRGAESLATRTALAAEPVLQPSSREVPDVATVLRALKLVTVEIDTGVRSSSESESWRGDVKATVIAPVRLYYGVDLSGLAQADIWKNPLTGGITLRLPKPRRIAVEVFGSDTKTDVHVGGTRFRSLAGEYYLGLARTKLDEQARRMTLSKDDQQRLEQATREQVEKLVRALNGQKTHVTVEFARDEGVAGAEGADGAGTRDGDRP